MVVEIQMQLLEHQKEEHMRTQSNTLKLPFVKAHYIKLSISITSESLLTNFKTC